MITLIYHPINTNGLHLNENGTIGLANYMCTMGNPRVTSMSLFCANIYDKTDYKEKSDYNDKPVLRKMKLIFNVIP